MAGERDLIEKRNEYWRARATADRLWRELRQMEFAAARGKLKRLTPHQRALMAAIVHDDFRDDEFCYSRRHIENVSGLTRAQSGRAIAALRRLGFIDLHRGLFTDDGEPAGSGYATTLAGHDWWWEKEADRQPRGDHGG